MKKLIPMFSILISLVAATTAHAFLPNWAESLLDRWRKPVTSVQSCQEVLNRRVLAPSRSQLKTFSPEFPTWARVETLINNLSEESLQRTFRIISYQALSNLNAAMITGNINASQEDQLLLKELIEFASKFHKYLWPAESLTKDRLLRALNQYKVEQAQKDLQQGLYGIDPRTSIEALRKIEENIVAKATGDGVSRPGWWLSRYFSPTYKKFENLIHLITYILRESQAIHDVDYVVEDYLKRHEGILPENVVKELRRTIDDTPMQLASLQMLIVRIFGEDVVRGQVIDKENINLNHLNKMAKLSQYEDMETGSWLTSVLDIDRLADVMDELNNSNQSNFSYTDMKDRGLKVRGMIRDWNRVHQKENYLSILDRAPGGEVKYTTQHTTMICTSNGKTTTCTPLITYQTHYPTYAEILDDEYSSHGGIIVSSDTINWIRESSAKLRSTENTFRRELKQVEEFIHKSTVEFNEVQSTEAKVQKMKQEVQRYIALVNSRLPDLMTYSLWSTKKITEQWSEDLVQDFRDRNHVLVVRYRNALRALKIYAELLERDLDQMNPEYNLPDRSLLIGKFKKIWQWARGTQIASASLIGLSVAFSQFMPEEYDYLVHQTQYHWAVFQYERGQLESRPLPPEKGREYIYDPEIGTYVPQYRYGYRRW